MPIKNNWGSCTFCSLAIKRTDFKRKKKGAPLTAGGKHHLLWWLQLFGRGGCCQPTKCVSRGQKRDTHKKIVNSETLFVSFFWVSTSLDQCVKCDESLMTLGTLGPSEQQWQAFVFMLHSGPADSSSSTLPVHTLPPYPLPDGSIKGSAFERALWCLKTCQMKMFSWNIIQTKVVFSDIYTGLTWLKIMKMVFHYL